MAVAFDNDSEGDTAGVPSNTVSGTHVVAGSNRVMYVIAIGAIEIPIGATYNGVAMTEIYAAAPTPLFTNTALYRLIAPDTGSHSVVVTFDGSTEGCFVSISLTGADQTTPEDGEATEGEEDVAETSLGVTSAVDDLVLDALLIGDSSAVVMSGQTLIESVANGSLPLLLTSRKAGAAGTVNLGWDTFGGGIANVNHIVWNVNAAGGGGGALAWLPQAMMRRR